MHLYYFENHCNKYGRKEVKETDRIQILIFVLYLNARLSPPHHPKVLDRFLLKV